MSKITLICADFCKPCQHLKTLLPEIAKELNCDIPVIVEEYDEDNHFITKLPTMSFTIDGLEKARMVGTKKENVKAFLRTAMAFENISFWGYED